MNKTIAMITAGILAAGLMAIATSAGNAFAASSGGTATFGGNFATHAEAAPGQSASSAGGNLNGVGTSSSASDNHQANSAAGSTVVCPTQSGVGSTASAGSCSATSLP